MGGLGGGLTRRGNGPQLVGRKPPATGSSQAVGIVGFFGEFSSWKMSLLHPLADGHIRQLANGCSRRYSTDRLDGGFEVFDVHAKMKPQV